MAVVEFVIPRLLPTMNWYLRAHWAVRRKVARTIAWEILAALGGRRPAELIDPALVTVERICVRAPDDDNLTAGCKILLDALCPLSATHPYGLGIIRDDSPAHCTLVTFATLVGQLSRTATRVRIEPRDILSDLKPVESGAQR